MRASGSSTPSNLPDRHLELFAHAAICPAGARDQLHAADAAGRQRDRASRRQAFHQHAPALPDARGAADDVIHRDEHILALRRAVQECGIQREVASPDLHARRIGGDQRERDAEIGFAAQQVVGVMQLESQTEQRG